MQQLLKGQTITDVAPGKTVTSSVLNNLVDEAILLNGAVIDQSDITTRAAHPRMIAGDKILVGDSTAADTALPLAVDIEDLLLQEQIDGEMQFDANASSAGGAGAAYTVTLPAAVTAYVDGMVVRFKSDAANAGAVTVAINGLAAKGVKNRLGNALVAADIASGQMVELIYDAGNGWFVFQAPTPVNSISPAQFTENARDGAYQHESAVTVHTTGGGFDIYAVTLAVMPTVGGLVAGLRLSFLVPAVNSLGQSKLTMAGVSGGVQVPILKKGAILLAPGDLPAGAVALVIYDGTNFQLLNPGASWDYISTGDAFPGSTAKLDKAHGLGAVPTRLRVVVVPDSTQNSYDANDEVAIESLQYDGSASQAFAVSADATNVTIAQINSANVAIIPKIGGAFASMTEANWKIKVYAAL